MRHGSERAYSVSSRSSVAVAYSLTVERACVCITSTLFSEARYNNTRQEMSILLNRIRRKSDLHRLQYAMPALLEGL